jgi:hypothetical protein
MGLQLKDRMELSITFNGKEFPLQPVNSLDFLHMSCGTQLSIPILHFRVIDTVSWLATNNALVDGALIHILLKVKDVQRSFYFRYFTHKEILTTTGVSYEIDAYFNNVPYWLSSTVTPVKGTSSFVLQEMAKRCNISTYLGNATADEQVWIPANKVNWNFAKFIATHGYVNDASCMQLGFDFNDALIYKNITQKLAATATFITGLFRSQTHLVSDFRLKNQSGLLNAVSGYDDKLFSPSVIENDAEHSKVQINKLTQKAMINNEIWDKTDRSRVLFSPINVGNVHTNYERATYQNDRIANTYSYGLEIVTPDVTNVKLLDLVDFECNRPNDQGDRASSGTYLVVSRTLFIKGINYAEKLGIVRHGLNATVSSQV